MRDDRSSGREKSVFKRSKIELDYARDTDDDDAMYISPACRPYPQISTPHANSYINFRCISPLSHPRSTILMLSAPGIRGR